MSEQLIKKNLTGGYKNVNPKSWIEAIKDKGTGQNLVEILQGINMYYLSYTDNAMTTRLQVPRILRKKGLWIVYEDYSGELHVEWYNNNSISDDYWKLDSNWCNIDFTGGSNLKFKIENNTLYISYNEGVSWEELGALNFLADEEDTTLFTSATKTIIKFKDRDTSKGMGYVILRANKTISEQLTQSNTIYEIRYDFDLNGEEIVIPEDCVLDFQGGSFSNGIIIGNNAKVDGILNYSIFNDCIVKQFDIPYIDIRWTGAVSDCDMDSGTGTDSSDAIQMAIDNILMNHLDSYLYVVGNYYIGKQITTPCLMMKGENPVGFDWGYEYSKEYKFKHSSGFYIAENITAFKVDGYSRISGTTTYAYIEVENLYLTSKKESKTSVFFYHTASGFPSRPGWLEKVSAQYLDKVCSFELKESATSYFTFSIEKCYVTHCNYAVYAKTYDKKVNVGGFNIQNNVLEQGGRIYIEIPLGSISIHDNLLEGQSNAVVIDCYAHSSVSVFNNYFEANTEDIIKINAINTNVLIYHNYFANCAQGLVTITGGGAKHNSLRCFDNSFTKLGTVECYVRNIAIYEIDRNFKNNISGYFFGNTRNTKADSIASYLIYLDPSECFVDTVRDNTSQNGINIITVNRLKNAFTTTYYLPSLGKDIQAAYITEQTQLSPSYVNINGKIGDSVYLVFYASKQCSIMLAVEGVLYKTFTATAGINIWRFILDRDTLTAAMFALAPTDDIPYFISVPVFYHVPSEAMEELKINNIDKIPIRIYTTSGITPHRPTFPWEGQMYIDTTINKPIWWDGSYWVDANGVHVDEETESSTI